MRRCFETNIITITIYTVLNINEVIMV